MAVVIIGCVLVFVLFQVLGSAGDDVETDPEREPTITSQSTATATTPAPAAPEPAASTALDEKADTLAAVYGYTSPSDPPGTGAGLARTTCRRAADGWDYETAVADDISVGAPESVAVDWNSFVYEEYCPAY